MDISNFNSLLQLTATLNLALVAVEYVSKFRETIVYDILRYEKKICKILANSVSKLIDITSLNLIINKCPDTMGTRDSSPAIQKILERHTTINNRFEASTKLYKDRVESECFAKTLSPISLWLAIYSVIGLLLGSLIVDRGVEVVTFIDKFWIWGTFATVLFLVFQWSWGERKEWMQKYFGLQGSLILFMFFFNGSAVLAWLYSDWIYIGMRDVIFFISAVIPFSGFIAFFIIVNKKYRGIKTKAKEDAEQIRQSVELLESEIQTLRSAIKFHLDNTTPNFSTDEILITDDQH